jgi:voltage-gated potassium channel
MKRFGCEHGLRVDVESAIIADRPVGSFCIALRAKALNWVYKTRKSPMLKYSLFGLLLVAITVVIHAFGTTWLLLHLGRRYDKVTGPYKTTTILRILIGTVIAITALHIVQITVWAWAYMILLPEAVLGTFEEAIYFSFVTFTTLGYGDITLPEVWRILSGYEALNGVLLIGWSTAMLFAVVQRTWKNALRANADNE